MCIPACAPPLIDGESTRVGQSGHSQGWARPGRANQRSRRAGINGPANHGGDRPGAQRDRNLRPTPPAAQWACGRAPLPVPYRTRRPLQQRRPTRHAGFKALALLWLCSGSALALSAPSVVFLYGLIRPLILFCLSRDANWPLLVPTSGFFRVPSSLPLSSSIAVPTQLATTQPFDILIP